ncbi:MAG: signal peptidase I [Acidimicrobiales bacterium]
MHDEGAGDSSAVLQAEPETTVETVAASQAEAEAVAEPKPEGELDGEPEPEEEPRSFARRAVPWIVLVVLAATAAVLLRTFAFQTFFVPSSSMEPTLMPGDRMLVLKFDLGTIQRGEIIVFKRPPGDTEDFNNEDLVKRVIGLPGETIYSVGSTIYINGRAIAQPWLPKGTPPGQAIPMLKIPNNDYFVMGDNRQFSYDSRFWNPHFVPRANIIGQVLFVIWRSGHPYFKAF